LVLKSHTNATHNLTAVNNDLLNFKYSQIFANRTYFDESTKKNLIKINSKLHALIKISLSKNTHSSVEKVYSQSASSIKQSIEIIFNWLIISSGIQIASKVRSTKGLIVHVFGR
jgi:hypothetical protein